jgi:hypothetical protein
MRGILTATVLLTLAGCSPFTINADYDNTADFGRYRTWSWFTGPHPYGAGVDQLLDNRIRASLEAELPHHGLAKAADGSSDLLVSYHLSVAQRIEVNPTTASVGYGWGRGYVAYSSGGDIRTYDEGTLIVDLVDAKTKNLVWRGIAKATVYANSTPEERTERVRTAIQAILDQYPPIK